MMLLEIRNCRGKNNEIKLHDKFGGFELVCSIRIVVRKASSKNCTGL